jgi:hypothetical protein
MRGQFKQDDFNVIKIMDFTDELIASGLNIEVIWKKGFRTLNSPSEANVVDVKLNDKLIFKQNRKAGFVNIDKLDDADKRIVLKGLSKHRFFTIPNWTLSIVLCVVYLLLIGIAAFGRSDIFSTLLLVGALAVMVFLIVAYKIADKKMANDLLLPVGIFGGLGYLFTIPSSILTIFLYQQISRHALFKELEEAH